MDYGLKSHSNKTGSALDIGESADENRQNGGNAKVLR